jgi:hypothetical protein
VACSSIAESSSRPADSILSASPRSQVVQDAQLRRFLVQQREQVEDKAAFGPAAIEAMSKAFRRAVIISVISPVSERNNSR